MRRNLFLNASNHAPTLAESSDKAAIQQEIKQLEDQLRSLTFKLEDQNVADNKQLVSLFQFESLVDEKVTGGVETHLDFLVHELSIAQTASVEYSPPDQLLSSFVFLQLDANFKVFVASCLQVLQSYGSVIQLYFHKKVLNSPKYKSLAASPQTNSAARKYLNSACSKMMIQLNSKVF